MLVGLLSVLTTLSAARAEPLKIAYSDWPGFLPFEVVLQKGYFKEAGVDVELTWFEYGPSIEAFAAGRIDAVPISQFDALTLGASGKLSTAAFLTDTSSGNEMIVGQNGVESIKALKGKKVGVEVNLVEHFVLLNALERNGLKEEDVTLVNSPTNELPKVLASGGVDAVAVWYPIGGQALREVAGSKVLFSTKEVPGLVYDALFVDRASLAARRDDWRKVAKAWFMAINFINDPATRGEAMKLMAARVNLTPKEFAENLQGSYPFTLEQSLKHLAPGEGLDSVYGSSKLVDSFAVAKKIYAEPQDVAPYFDGNVAKDLK
jgi:NitT/TauT family transport system substrate-binding protein